MSFVCIFKFTDYPYSLYGRNALFFGERFGRALSLKILLHSPGAFATRIVATRPANQQEGKSAMHVLYWTTKGESTSSIAFVKRYRYQVSVPIPVVPIVVPVPISISKSILLLAKDGSLSKYWKDKRSLVQLSRVILETFLYFITWCSLRFFAFTPTLGGNNKANLSRGICGDCCVRILDCRKSLANGINQWSNKVQVQPHALSLCADNSSFS